MIGKETALRVEVNGQRASAMWIHIHSGEMSKRNEDMWATRRFFGGEHQNVPQKNEKEMKCMCGV